MVSCSMGRLNWCGTDWVGHGRAGAPKRWMAAHGMDGRGLRVDIHVSCVVSFGIKKKKGLLGRLTLENIPIGWSTHHRKIQHNLCQVTQGNQGHSG